MRKRQLAAISVLTLVVAAFATVGLKTLLQSSVTKPTRVVVTTAPDPAAKAREACRRLRDAVLEETPLPGTPALDALRAEVVARAKSEPVLFLEAPVARSVPKDLVAFRERLFKDGVPWQALNDVFSKLKRYPKRLRQVILTDGYLWAERSDLAALLAGGISLNHLFDERELELTRGNSTRSAIRKRNDYVWADGPDAGQIAYLWLFDRVRVKGEVLSPDQHVAVGGLEVRLGTTRIDVERLTRRAVAVRLIYGEHAVEALLRIKDSSLELECEIVPPGQAAQIESARAINRRRARVLARLRTAVDEQVDEGLPFDEPKTEEGQQDGKLRGEWRTAYLQGKNTFEFNEDKYPVFGRRGLPHVPQVCVDFITDSWERLADTRWAKRGEKRERRIGRLDFNALGIENRRSVENLIDFAVSHPEWFELLLVPESERVAFSNRSEFFRRLYALRSDFQPGDVVAILGPRDDEKLHYHSFFILARDPLTSMPTLLAANAGRPRIRTWEGEMQNAPRRSIVARIRPRLEWIEAVAGVSTDQPPAVAKL